MNPVHKHKILIVDDDAQTLAALERLFKSKFNVEAFSHPGVAIKAMNLYKNSLERPAVILSDFKLPEMSGLEFLKQCKEICPESIRVILSGHLGLDTLRKAVTDGEIHRVLMKPWENDILLLQMEEYLAQFETLRQKGVLEKLATTDPVTQVYNRRFFEDQLNIEIERAERHNRTLSLLMIDADRFKGYNDEFGHPLGDQLLIRISKHLCDCVRQIDFVSRFGGDEFAIILPDTNKSSAFDIAERIRSTLIAKFILDKIEVTLSIGVATFPEDALKSGPLIEKADQALFQAKKLGRNKVVIA